MSNVEGEHILADIEAASDTRDQLLFAIARILLRAGAQLSPEEWAAGTQIAVYLSGAEYELLKDLMK